MRKINKNVVICISMVVILGFGYFFMGNFKIKNNNRKLKASIEKLEMGKVNLNDIVPFEWEALYTLPPYSTKESIEEIIGFKSNDIKENWINEGMVNILFTKGEEIVSSVLGYSERLGYNLKFSSKINFKDNETFNVSTKEKIINLEHIK